MKPRRLLLVEDHAIVRAGLRALLESLEGIAIIGEASDGREALRKVRLFKPDIVLTDLSMPGLNGIEVVERIKKDHSQIHVIVLSMYTGEEFVSRALRAGADGYLVKNAALEEIGLAIDATTRNEVFLSSAISNTVVSKYLSNYEDTDDPTKKPKEVDALTALLESDSACGGR